MSNFVGTKEILGAHEDKPCDKWGMWGLPALTPNLASKMPACCSCAYASRCPSPQPHLNMHPRAAMLRGHTFQLTCVMLSGRQVVLQARKHHKIAAICERLADELNVNEVLLVYMGEVLAGGPAELRH